MESQSEFNARRMKERAADDHISEVEDAIEALYNAGRIDAEEYAVCKACLAVLTEINEGYHISGMPLLTLIASLKEYGVK